PSGSASARSASSTARARGPCGAWCTPPSSATRASSATSSAIRPAAPGARRWSSSRSIDRASLRDLGPLEALEDLGERGDDGAETVDAVDRDRLHVLGARQALDD